MPFEDAREFLTWLFGPKPKAESSRMTPDDFREMRQRARALNG